MTETIELPDDRVTKRLVKSIIDSYPEFTLTSHIGPDDNEYIMVQLANGNDLNQAAPGEFVSMVEGLDS